MKKMLALFLDLNESQQNLIRFKMLKIVIRRGHTAHEHIRQLSKFMQDTKPLDDAQISMAIDDLETLEVPPKM